MRVKISYFHEILMQGWNFHTEMKSIFRCPWICGNIYFVLERDAKRFKSPVHISKPSPPLNNLKCCIIDKLLALRPPWHTNNYFSFPFSKKKLFLIPRAQNGYHVTGNVLTIFHGRSSHCASSLKNNSIGKSNCSITNLFVSTWSRCGDNGHQRLVIHIYCSDSTY